jgi:hypothetical protein
MRKTSKDRTTGGRYWSQSVTRERKVEEVER